MKILILIMLTSCAKLSYLAEQGVGQLRLQWNGKKVEKVLSDPEVKNEVKEKIKKIEVYKKYFYDYFEKKPSAIYSKVTFLENQAVTHLVIASYYDRVEPLKTSFPFMGAFPYLGFFKEKSAIKYQEKLEKKDYHTYKRPVYAYSTLGKLQDRILSSFFRYSDEGLAELIFHELFHTIFFVKSNVDLNENLANYFGKEMMKEYFHFDEAKNQKMNSSYKSSKVIRSTLVSLIKKYKAGIKKKPIKSPKEGKERLNSFLENSFFPKIKKTCSELGLKKCFPLEMKWNHASFSAFMTYEKKGEFIKDLRSKYKIKNLKEYYHFLESQLEIFKKEKKYKSFTKHLEGLL